MNPGYTFFYVEANVVCVIIFAILLIKNLNSVDRQEKQRIYDRVLISSMMYFACDSFWAMIEGGSIPSTRLGVDIVNYGNSVILAFMTYYWFLYVEVSRGAKYMNKRRNRVYTMILAIISPVVMFILFAFFNDLVIDQDNETTLLYAIIFLSAPVVYILTSAIASFVRAAKNSIYSAPMHMGYRPDTCPECPALLLRLYDHDDLCLRKVPGQHGITRSSDEP